MALIVCLLLSSAQALDLGRTPPPKDLPGEPYQGGGRSGGDTIGDATRIPALPFADQGGTCGYGNDYDEVCPYPGSTAPDVVYVYESTAEEYVFCELCQASYDSKIYVWEDVEGQVVACSDDACGLGGYQSKIEYLLLASGHTYYFVVDGYAAQCGDYSLLIHHVYVDPLVCPDGAQQEGEPPCEDEYVDEYNGGCCCAGETVFTPILPDPQGTAVMCGKSCTYHVHGLSYRDTDWFVLEAGELVRATCTAEFPVLFLLIYTGCEDLQYIHAFGSAYEPVTLEWTFEPGRQFYLWVGPSTFSGIPESDYVLEVSGLRREASSVGEGTEDGLHPPFPESSGTWGRMKDLFR